MLRSTNELIGYHLRAEDGPFGKVDDFLFDDRKWALRYLVADTGDWLGKRRFLLSPQLLRDPDLGKHHSGFPILATKAQIEASPPITDDAPVSLQYEQLLAEHYAYSGYWNGADIWGNMAMPMPAAAAGEAVRDMQAREAEIKENHLHSARSVSGYEIAVADGKIGQLEDFMLESRSWSIRYLVLNTGSWLRNRRVLISPEWVEHLDWRSETAELSIPRSAIEDSPEFDPTRPVNVDYEDRLYDYYGKERRA